MRILFVEDEQDWLDELSAELTAIDDDVTVIPARSSESAVALLKSEEFDFIICDLRIPPSDGGIAADEIQGFFVQGRARQLRPGVPCMFLTAYATAKNIRSPLSEGGNEDIFGTGELFPMVVQLSKDELPEVIAEMSAFVSQRRELDRIQITLDEEMAVPDYVALGLRIFARRHCGVDVRIRPEGGGLSGAVTLRATVDGTSGMRARVFAKFDDRQATLLEQKLYDQCLPAILAPNTFASHVDKIAAGLGSKGAIFYQLAEGYDRDLFKLLGESDDRAGRAVSKLRKKVEPWLMTTEGRQREIGEMRRNAVPDEVLANYSADLGALDHRLLDNSLAQMSMCYQHGDLHGANILVDLDDEPLLIDFGDLGLAPSCLDPIVLELSALFHPRGRSATGEWATPEMAEQWHDLDAWASASPIPEFIRSCRQWASAATENDSEWLCVAYIEALRQLKYPDTRKDLAVAIAKSAGEACLRSMAEAG